MLALRSTVKAWESVAADWRKAAEDWKKTAEDWKEKAARATRERTAAEHQRYVALRAATALAQRFDVPLDDLLKQVEERGTAYFDSCAFDDTSYPALQEAAKRWERKA